MDYKAHYDKLIARGLRTCIHGYRESHHIIPKCLNGTDDNDNLVYLTASEHYVAHQLLVKMYPTCRELIHAANMMCVKDSNQKRNNKEYSWLKQRRSEFMKIQMQGNSLAKGSVRSDEFKENLSKRWIGVKKAPISEDTKKNMSTSQKLRFEKMTPEERKKKPRTQEHTDNWRASMQRRKEQKLWTKQ